MQSGICTAQSAGEAKQQASPAVQKLQKLQIEAARTALWPFGPSKRDFSSPLLLPARARLICQFRVAIRYLHKNWVLCVVQRGLLCVDPPRPGFTQRSFTSPNPN